jgi:Peptidase C13 family
VLSVRWLLNFAARVLVLSMVLVIGEASVLFVAPSFDAPAFIWSQGAHAKDPVRGVRERDPEIATARLQDSQPALLQAAFSRLAPQRKGTTDIYTVAVAGWSSQDVFIKEVDGALTVLERSLPTKDRALRLLNNPETVRKTPLATHRNLAAALHAVGETMDKNEDILLLFMTSHGGMGGLGLQFPGGGGAVLRAHEIKATLDSEGIRNRIVIVSACYGGVFVPPLANDDTIVLTAADALSTSFGCAPGRDWTYFGDALFKQSLQPGTDFRQAFDHARILIQAWEMLDRVPPSNPQGHFGPALVTKLDPLFKAMAGQ